MRVKIHLMSVKICLLNAKKPLNEVKNKYQIIDSKNVTTLYNFILLLKGKIELEYLSKNLIIQNQRILIFQCKTDCYLCDNRSLYMIFSEQKFP